MNHVIVQRRGWFVPEVLLSHSDFFPWLQNLPRNKLLLRSVGVFSFSFGSIPRTVPTNRLTSLIRRVEWVAGAVGYRGS